MRFHSTHLELMPGVPLYVYAVRGDHSSAIIDTGVRAMHDAVLGLCEKVSRNSGSSQKPSGGDTPLSWILTTHAHADHIGNHHAVSQKYRTKIACGGNTGWLEDFGLHYQEFCLPGLVVETPGQRDEILGLMDAPTRVDLILTTGSVVCLGGIEIEVLAFPGHKLEEIGFLERDTATLILGDLLLALAAPFFHGFDTASGFRDSLIRLAGLIEAGTVKSVLAAHHPPLEAEAALVAVAQTRAFLDDVEQATLEAANGVKFETLWRSVSAKLGKVADFRGYAMLRAQVLELETSGRLRRTDGILERA